MWVGAGWWISSKNFVTYDRLVVRQSGGLSQRDSDNMSFSILHVYSLCFVQFLFQFFIFYLQIHPGSPCILYTLADLQLHPCMSPCTPDMTTKCSSSRPWSWLKRKARVYVLGERTALGCTWRRIHSYGRCKQAVLC